MYHTNHNFVLEIDPEFLNYKDGIFTPTEGTLYERLPKHGSVQYTQAKSKVKRGHVGYFIHYALDSLWKQDHKTFISVPNSDLLGYSTDLGKNIKSHSFVVAEKIKEEEDSPIITQLETQYFTQKFKVRNCDKKLIKGVSRGDILWCWKDSDYPITYIDDVVFLDAEHIVYNESTDELLNSYVLVEPLDEDEEYEMVNGVYIPRKEKVNKGYGRVLKCNENDIIKEGDHIIYKKTSYNYLKEGVNAVKFEYIKCYERN